MCAPPCPPAAWVPRQGSARTPSAAYPWRAHRLGGRTCPRLPALPGATPRPRQCLALRACLGRGDGQRGLGQARGRHAEKATRATPSARHHCADRATPDYPAIHRGTGGAHPAGPRCRHATAGVGSPASSARRVARVTDRKSNGFFGPGHACHSVPADTPAAHGACGAPSVPRPPTRAARCQVKAFFSCKSHRADAARLRAPLSLVTTSRGPRE